VETIDPESLAGSLLQAASGGRRLIVALAGAPASGKSTLADRLAGTMNAAAPGTAAVLAMDGFHFDDLHLDPAGLRGRKGAPETFDVGGLGQALRRLRAADEAFVAVPVFDRELEIARAGARLIGAATPVVIVEGNYLLLDAEPWRALRPLFDVTAFLDVPEPVLADRLAQRWRGLGFGEEEVRRRLEENDLPNARRVIAESAPARYRLAGG
jgi:pantothenate kinase